MALLRGRSFCQPYRVDRYCRGRSRWRRYSAATRNIPASLAAEIGAAGGLVGIVLSTQLFGGSTLARPCDDPLAVESAGEITSRSAPTWTAR